MYNSSNEQYTHIMSDVQVLCIVHIELYSTEYQNCCANKVRICVAIRMYGTVMCIFHLLLQHEQPVLKDNYMTRM